MSFFTPAPPNPTPTEPSTFRTRAINLFNWITGTMIGEMETLNDNVTAAAAALTLNSTNDTSASSVLIGTGLKNFVVSAGKSYVAGMWLTFADSTNIGNSMVGQVSSYSGTALVVDVPAYGVFGSGTPTSWSIALTAVPCVDINAAIAASDAAKQQREITAIGFDSTGYIDAAPVYCAGRLVANDGGGGHFYYSSAALTADNINIFAASGGGFLVRQGYTSLGFCGDVLAVWAGADPTLNTDCSTSLQKIFSLGYNSFLISTGRYLFGAPLTQNNSAGIPIPGGQSPRNKVSGAGRANTLLNYSGTGYAISLVGSGDDGVSQGISAFDVYTDFTLQSQGLTKTTGQSGLHLTNKAYLKLADLMIHYLDVGLRLDSIYSSVVRDSNIANCNIGVILGTTGLGACNALTIDNVEVNGCSKYGVLIAAIGASNKVQNSRIEGNGTQGDSEAFGVIGNIGAYGFAGPLIFENVYFEANAGGADVQLDNITNQPCTVIFRGCIFQRTMASFFTNSNIVVLSTGGGIVTVILEGCQFQSQGSYTASESRPYWSNGGNNKVQFFDNGGNTWNETVSLPVINLYSGRDWAYASVIGATGVIDVGQGLLCTRSALGTYTFAFLRNPHNGSYSISCDLDQGAGSGVGFSVSSKTATGFTIVCKNSSGVIVDAWNLSVVIKS